MINPEQDGYSASCPGQYRAFARAYEVDIDAAAVADIYASWLLDQELRSRIDPERVLYEMLGELRQVGYPVPV